MGGLIAYFRVSTAKQGESGLGLDAQRAAVAEFARRGPHEVLAAYQEVETGKRADRPELHKAIRHARRARATLVIAKLDRLARNVHFLSGLMESGVDFVAVDMPAANRLTLHIMAAVAEDEARRISERTRAALAAFKARGGRLGTPRNLTPEARARGSILGAAAARARADDAYADVMPLVLELRGRGLSQRAIAGRLNADGHATRRGRPWNQVQVKRVLDRAADRNSGERAGCP